MGSEAERTLWCGNLSDQVTEELLYELFLQVSMLETKRLLYYRPLSFPCFSFNALVLSGKIYL